MGWNSLNHYGTHFTDKDVRATADAMATNGMRRPVTSVSISTTGGRVRGMSSLEVSRSLHPSTLTAKNVSRSPSTVNGTRISTTKPFQPKTKKTATIENGHSSVHSQHLL